MFRSWLVNYRKILTHAIENIFIFVVINAIVLGSLYWLVGVLAQTPALDSTTEFDDSSLDNFESLRPFVHTEVGEIDGTFNYDSFHVEVQFESSNVDKYLQYLDKNYRDFDCALIQKTPDKRRYRLSEHYDVTIRVNRRTGFVMVEVT